MELNLTLNEVATITAGTLHGKNTEVSCINTDTRILQKGDMFAALKGEQLDGHEYINVALEKGASAIISEQTLTQGTYIKVNDARVALGQIAQYHRSRFNLPVIAVTGSCGKTTTRVMLVGILAQCGNTHASQSSFNNDVGLPLTLFNLTKQHQYSVLELGTNHFGELSYLTAIAKPTVAIITNVAPVHVEFLLNEWGVARAKAEIFQGLHPQGMAVIEANSPFVDYFKEIVAPRKVITFGLSEKADVSARNIHLTPQGYSEFEAITPHGNISIQLSLLGQHNIVNALAAIAATQATGASLQQIQCGLANLQPEKKRLVIKAAKNGAVIIDDSYNANLLSVKAALDVLQARPEKIKVFVMGDMKELGDLSVSHHQLVGEYAKQKNIDHFIAFGPLTKESVQVFGEKARHFDDKQLLIAYLQKILAADMCVIVKGSRSMKMEEVVEALLKQNSL